ncbi:hypothetical protein RclHR1_25370002 [Rhizophagus clarus]|uniref:Endonuclease/exonuclease/phosphatase domain-containing protein n=1 Tax=Rhizophagus clarus TaxID=94130 RepID=A0A2Z6QZ29_9GLOM|nr:hypothetical protein RclHR1_25370002 [Rhizophagus clarus]
MGGILFLDLPKSYPVSLHGGSEILSSRICRHPHSAAPNIKDIDLAPLIRELGAKAVNIPLSLNSYKPKRWAYITFPSQELMDVAMEQLIGYQERFHVGQPSRPKTTSRSRSHSRLRSKGPDNSRPSQHQQSSSTQSKVNIPNNQRNRSKSNDKRDRSVSFSSALRTPPLSSTCKQPPSLSPQDASEILSLLKVLQQDMADVRDRITAFELNDQRMTRIERHIGLQSLSSVPPTATQSSDMNIDQPDVSRPSLAQDSPPCMSHSRSLNPFYLILSLRHLILHTPTSDQALRDTTIDLLIQALSDTKRLGFHHAICGDFNMHLDQFYPIFFNQTQIASKRIHRLFNFLLSSGYVDFTPINFSDSLGTFHRADVITRIDYIWSCPLLKSFLLTSIISDVCDSSLSDHNPIVTYFDSFLLSSSVKLASGLHLLKDKEYQDLSIKSHIEKRDLNFDTDISSFINSALSRSRRRIVLDRVFIDHPTAPRLLTDPLDISDAVVNHFQHAVPIKSTPPVHISALLTDGGLTHSPPCLNGKAPGPSMITYEMLKHLGPAANALLLALICKCFASADIPDLWRQAMVFPIPKPHEWRCQLQNTRPITLLEVIQKSFVKLLYNRLSSILAAHNVLTGGNFAGLPGGTCRDPIITLESIIHHAIAPIPHCGSSPKIFLRHLTLFISLC